MRLVGFFLFLSFIGNAATITVDLRGGGDYTEIQAAIDAAADGDRVRVAPGEHAITSPINFHGKAIAVASVSGPEETKVVMAQPPTDPERASVAIFESGETGESVLNGFTLQGGSGTRWGIEEPEDGGGGILLLNESSPTIRNCTISGNTSYRGGGVYSRSSSPELSHCTISGNSSVVGGAVYCVGQSTPVLTNCAIAENKTNWYGGGMTCRAQANATLMSCTVLRNWSQDGSGGFYCNAAVPELVDCTITENCGGCGRLGGFGTGGVYCERSSLTLTDCTITGNWGNTDGGGITCEGNPAAILANCTITANRGKWAGGVYCHNSSPVFTECTIAGNTAENFGGVCCTRSSPKLRNCTTAYNRTGGSRPAFACGGGSSPELMNCTFTGNWAGSLGSSFSCSATLTNCIVWGNSPESVSADLASCLIDQDPLFIHQGVFDFTRLRVVTIQGDVIRIPNYVVEPPDYRLQPDSPCIDAGTSEGAPVVDRDGCGRPCGRAVDIGAHEFGGCPPIEEWFVRGDGNGDNQLNIADAILIFWHLFAQGDAPACFDAADANDDGEADISDGIFILQNLFGNGPEIPPPYPECGIDSTLDELRCEDYPGC